MCLTEELCDDVLKINCRCTRTGATTCALQKSPVTTHSKSIGELHANWLDARQPERSTKTSPLEVLLALHLGQPGHGPVESEYLIGHVLSPTRARIEKFARQRIG